MEKTEKEILDDHLSLCVLAYARLTAGRSERDDIEHRENDTMGLAIQAASLFTVASMDALGDPGRTARAFELAREMFSNLGDVPSVSDACTASLGVLEDVLVHTDDGAKGGAASGDGESAPDTFGARATSSRRRRGKTPPSP